jgi:hypothetical protein
MTLVLSYISVKSLKKISKKFLDLGSFLLDSGIIVNAAVIKFLQGLQGLAHLRAVAHVVLVIAVGDQIADQAVDDSAVGAAQPVGGQRGQLVPGDEIQGDGVFQVPADVTDGISQPDHTTLQGHGLEGEVRIGQLQAYFFFQALKSLFPIGGQTFQVRLAIVAENAVQDLKGEIQPPTAFFHPIQEPDALDAVEKRPDIVLLTESGEDPFAVMAEGGVTDVVAEGYGFDEILIKAQVSANGTGNLGKELDVENPVANVFVFYEIKDLGFVDIAGIGAGMQDAVGVHREILAVTFLNPLFKAAAAGLGALGGIGGQANFLLPVELQA